MGDRVAVIKGGILQQVGPPQFLYDNPANIFVAGFIGSPPMNLGDGHGRSSWAKGSDSGSAPPPWRCTRPSWQDHPALANWVGPGHRGRDPQRGHGGRQPGSRRRAGELHAGGHGRADRGLGSEIVVHFDLDVPKVVTEDTKLLEKDSGADDTGLAHRGHPVRGVVCAAVAGADRRQDPGRR